MSKFSFRLQKLLELRKWQEEQAAEALVSARRRADKAQRARDTLRSVREKSLGEMARRRADGGNVGQFQNMSYLMARLEERIHGAEGRCLAAENEVEGRRSEYEVWFRKRHALNKLRELAHEQWKVEQVQSEQRALDDIAVTRFSRQAGVNANGTGR